MPQHEMSARVEQSVLISETIVAIVGAEGFNTCTVNSVSVGVVTEVRTHSRRSVSPTMHGFLTLTVTERNN